VKRQIILISSDIYVQKLTTSNQFVVWKGELLSNEHPWTVSWRILVVSHRFWSLLMIHSLHKLIKETICKIHLYFQLLELQLLTYRVISLEVSNLYE